MPIQSPSLSSLSSRISELHPLMIINVSKHQQPIFPSPLSSFIIFTCQNRGNWPTPGAKHREWWESLTGWHRPVRSQESPAMATTSDVPLEMKSCGILDIVEISNVPLESLEISWNYCRSVFQIRSVIQNLCGKVILLSNMVILGSHIWKVRMFKQTNLVLFVRTMCRWILLI